MPNMTTEYATPVAMTCTLTSLSASATVGRSSAEVDNSTDEYVDAVVQAQITMAGSGTVTGEIQFYVVGSLDGTTYDGDTSYSGSDASYTLAAAGGANMKFAAAIYNLATSTARQVSFAIAPLFGGRMPKFWAVIVINNSGGAALGSSGNSLTYQGIKYGVN